MLSLLSHFLQPQVQGVKKAQKLVAICQGAGPGSRTDTVTWKVMAKDALMCCPMKRRLFADLLAAETEWLDSLSEPGEGQQLPSKVEWRRQDLSDNLCNFQTNIGKLNHRQTGFPVALPDNYMLRMMSEDSSSC